MCALMDERLETRRFGFRLAETPLFVPADLRERCVEAAAGILEIIGRSEVIEACQAAIPERFRAPNADRLPHFLAIDFAVVAGAGGRLEPRLIELQGFSSLYGMQFVQSGIWGEVCAGIPGMPAALTALFSGLTPEGYLALLRRTVIADADP